MPRISKPDLPSFQAPCPSPLDLYSIAEAAAIVRMSESTLRRWIRKGRIPYYGYRKVYRVNLADLLPRNIKNQNHPKSTRE